MSVPRSLRTGLILLAMALLLPACRTSVPMRSTRPGPVAVGPARHLVILDGNGRRSARETVFRELARQSRRGGWFTVDDLSEDGHRVSVTADKVKVQPRYPLEEEAAGLRLDILEWQATRSRRTVERTNEQGEVEEQTLHTVQGSVVIAVTFFDAWSRALLVESEYEGTSWGTVGEVTKDEVIDRSAANAVARFLADVTPRTVIQKVRLDRDDEGQRAILEIAENGNLVLAARRLAAYAESHPQVPAAAYNQAVLLDALGERYEALAWYDHALELGYQDYYASARAACARRIADAEALLPYPPPPALAR